MNLTMAVSALFGNQGQGVLSVGRVQTPTLALVVERDKKIEHFKSNTYYECIAEFQHNECAFKSKWVPNEECLDPEGYCTSTSVIDTVVKKVTLGQATVESFEKKNKKTSPPLCLSLSSLQKIGSSKLGLSVKQTLDIAQSLYETHKATSYPRTDTGYLPESQLNDAPMILKGLKNIHPDLTPLLEQCDLTLKSPTWNDKKITAHHGIIPTQNKNVDFDKMDQNEKAIYLLIVKHYIAQFLGDYTYEQRQVVIRVEEETFKSTANQPLQIGWRRTVEDLDNDSENENEAGNVSLPLLKEGLCLKVISARGLEKQTKPPARFTEGSLITAMKNIGKYVEGSHHKKLFKSISGIGTEATRANIIETLLSRGFLERKKKQLVSTKKGRHLIQLLPPMLTSPVTTAEWEDKLESIVSGDITLDVFLKAQTMALDKVLSILEKKSKLQLEKDIQTGKAYPCPNENCCGPLLKREGQYGPYWSCNEFPQCPYQAPDVNGKPGVPKPKAVKEI